MKPLKISVEFADGSIQYTEDAASINTIGLALLNKHVIWKKTSGIEALHNKYFQMLTELTKNSNTGYTKAELHECLKPLILSKFRDFKHFYSTGQPEYSTKHLTREGWIAVIEQLKSVANDIFGYIFKEL